MKKLFCMMAAAAAVTLYALPEFTVVYDKAEPVYKCGETARITITATENGELLKTGKVKATILREGGQNAIVKTVDFAKENPFVIETTSEKPGFIQVMLPTKKGKRVSNIARAGAGFDVEKIEMGYGLPADFTDFWQKGCKAMENTPVKLVKNDARSTDKYTFYDVSIKTFDNETMYGYLTVPTGKGPFPAYVLIPGAGPGFVSPDLKIAEAGAISLMMNITRFNCEPKPSIRKKNYNIYIKDGKYYLKGFAKRETYFFYSTYTAISRVIDYVAAMKEYNRKAMVVCGSSQGGGSALILAALNKNITATVSQVAALSDHGGAKKQRRPGWPSFASRTKEMNVTAETVDAVAPYFDAANFARFIKVPTFMTVGFIDRICYPGCVYAAYNQLKCEKEMINMPLTGHAISKEAAKKRDNWIYNKLGLKK